jgi:hypothetical protein
MKQSRLCRTMDCFAEPVIGRRFAPTRSLAMTKKAGIAPGLLFCRNYLSSKRVSAARPATT